MTEPDYTATQALRRVSPFWAWVRGNVTMPVLVSAGGVVLTVVAASIRVTIQIDLLAHQVAELATVVKNQQGKDTELAVLQQHVIDIDERVREHQARWDRVDENIERPPRPRR